MFNIRNKIKTWITNYHWKKNSIKLTDIKISYFDRAILASKLINKYNRPDLKGMLCNRYWISSYSYNLQEFIEDLEQFLSEYIIYGKISQDSKIRTLSETRLDRWCHYDTKQLRKMDLFECYIRAGNILLKLHSLADSKSKLFYIERKCNKYLATFITITELLGEIRYGGKK